MKRRELERRLRELDWHLTRHGGRHDVWTKEEREIVVPRHREINEGTGQGHSALGQRKVTMRFEGRVFKAGRSWAVEIPILGIATQGRSKKDAYAMAADAVETLVNSPDFHVDVFPGAGEYFEVGSANRAALTALLLRRQRVMRGVSLQEVARRLGAKSLNSYARYEQGRAAPTVEQLARLLAAVSSGRDFVLTESRVSRVA
ncbi:MAG: helix-turn-helix transcriptional regulator [Actinomycetia bacterium]|nr:helix-turn-helix transcriptional regulator [Actinomycetes bacterium]